LSLIMKENSYIRQVVEALPNKMIEEWENIKGSNVDMFLHAGSMFPEIDHELAMKLFAGVNLYYRNGCHLDDELFELLDKIRGAGTFLTVEKYQRSIKDESLRISNNGKYLKAIDTSGKVLVWDMVTAQLVDDYNMIKRLEWNIGDMSNKILGDLYSPEGDWILSKDKNYLAMRGVYANDVRENRVIYLYKRPSLPFCLCKIAIVNNENNRDELINLLKSKTLSSIKGFHKDYLVMLINDILADLPVRK
jgi:hypothetical protein